MEIELARFIALAAFERRIDGYKVKWKRREGSAARRIVGRTRHGSDYLGARMEEGRVLPPPLPTRDRRGICHPGKHDRAFLSRTRRKRTGRWRAAIPPAPRCCWPETSQPTHAGSHHDQRSHRVAQAGTP